MHEGRPIAPEQLEALLASLAHELNTPLAVIDSAVGLLRRTTEDPQRFDEIVSALERNVALMTLVVGRLRTLRLASEELDPDREPTDLTRLVETTVDDLRPTVLKRHDAVVTSPGPLIADVDVVLVRELLYNLLSNAAKFSPVDHEVQVALRRDDTDIELVVEDDGEGVAPEHAELIFERFGRANEDVPGLGVGLYLARQIARAHRGDLSLDPAPGRGARFVLWLPVDRGDLG